MTADPNYPGSQHLHDSTCCIFLGPVQTYDIYWCCDNEHPNLSSIMARYSDEGCEYVSTHVPLAFANPEQYLHQAQGWYHEALKRARSWTRPTQLYTANGWFLIGRLYLRLEERYGKKVEDYLRLGPEERMQQPPTLAEFTAELETHVRNQKN